MRRRSRVLLHDAVGTVVVVAVLAALVGGGWKLADVVDRHGAPSAARTTSSTTVVPASSTGDHPHTAAAGKGSPSGPPALGVYAGPGETAGAEEIDAGSGGKVTDVLDFLPAATWTQLSNPTWIEQSWAHTPFQAIIAVPMLPASGGTLAQGAAGDYDDAFALLAQRLVSGGLSSAILMIGWQPGSSQNPWEVTTPAQAAEYVAFWDRIHTVMTGVEGAHFRFEWDAGGPGAPVSPVDTYPGNSAVDIVGADAFDVGLGNVPAGQQWSWLNDQTYGPAWMASFAASHAKPLALAMVGLAPTDSDGAGDNAAFLSQALDWASSVHAAMVVLWDYSTWAITGGSFPAADAALTHALDQGILGVSGTDSG